MILLSVMCVILLYLNMVLTLYKCCVW